MFATRPVLTAGACRCRCCCRWTPFSARPAGFCCAEAVTAMGSAARQGNPLLFPIRV